MARLARIVVPGHPHHITQRGNRRQDVFFEEADYRAYRDLMGEWCAKRAVQVWAYCLMPNHVHLIALPETEDAPDRGGPLCGIEPSILIRGHNTNFLVLIRGHNTNFLGTSSCSAYDTLMEISIVSPY